MNLIKPKDNYFSNLLLTYLKHAPFHLFRAPLFLFNDNVFWLKISVA